jgi:hypothetical protein
MDSEFSAILAKGVLRLVQSMGYTVERSCVKSADGSEVWRLTARNQMNQRWIAEHEDLYQAAVLLAELVGADLEG